MWFFLSSPSFLFSIPAASLPPPCLPAAGARLDGEVTALGWNSSVPYILATALTAGSVVVWDLKESKPWCTLRDAHRAARQRLPLDGEWRKFKFSSLFRGFNPARQVLDVSLRVAGTAAVRVPRTDLAALPPRHPAGDPR